MSSHRRIIRPPYCRQLNLPFHHLALTGDGACPNAINRSTGALLNQSYSPARKDESCLGLIRTLLGTLKALQYAHTAVLTILWLSCRERHLSGTQTSFKKSSLSYSAAALAMMWERYKCLVECKTMPWPYSSSHRTYIIHCLFPPFANQRDSRNHNPVRITPHQKSGSIN